MIPDRLEAGPAGMSKAREQKGKLKSDFEEQRLMRSVIEDDNKTIDKGKLLSDAINQGFSSFVPDMTFENLVKNFSMARNLYGDRLLRLVTGHDAEYLRKNIKVPEFKRQLKEDIEKKSDELKKEGLLSRSGRITEKGITLASLIMYFEELERLIPKGISGDKVSKEKAFYGAREDIKEYRKGDRFRDIELRKSLRVAVKRGRSSLGMEELRTSTRTRKGSICVVYGIDASGSMKGSKIEAAKKAGIALSFKAIERRDRVGLIVFGKKVESKVNPTGDFIRLLKEIARTRARSETNLIDAIKESIGMFPRENITKHLVLITDALPTVGEDPVKETLASASLARNAGITISLIGINLDAKGRKFAEKVTETGCGRFYVLKSIDEADKVILEDYYSLG